MKTKRSRKLELATLVLIASSALPACGGPGDPYSQVVAACGYTDPNLSRSRIDLCESDRVKTTLTPECKAALEAVIPYDDASFASAPEGFKDHVTEAFQILVGYPIKLPSENKLLGVSPGLAGAIPLDHMRIFQEADNPNQAIFNYVLSQFDEVVYEPGSPDSGRTAQWMPQVSGKPRRMTIYAHFWNPGDLDTVIPTPFLRTSTIVHEARHGDGITHALCTDASEGFNCDEDMLGAYGFEMSYLHFLLQGSAVKPAPDQDPPISQASIMLIGTSLCQMLKPGTPYSKINHPFQEMLDLLSGVDCDTEISYAWTMQREGLPVLADYPADSGDPGASGATGETGPSGPTDPFGCGH